MEGARGRRSLSNSRARADEACALDNPRETKMADDLDALLARVEVAFECPDAKDIDDGGSGDPNGARALSKHKAQAVMAKYIMEVIRRACSDDFTPDGPMGGYAKDPVHTDLSDPDSFDRSVHDAETLIQEINRNDARY
jgi:hypothetical protein